MTIPIVNPSRAPAAPAVGVPLLRLGFRPFYLGAATWAALAVPWWLALRAGAVPAPAVTPLWWHAHEMLFGFAVAVIVGFLFTAGRAWTGLQTPRGLALGALALLWLAARVASLTGPAALYAALDLLLLPAVAAALGRVLWKAGNRRNLPLVGVLALLALANAGFHAAVAGWIGASPLAFLHAGLAGIVIVECVIAGRVVPAFTASAIPGVQATPQPRLAPAAMAATVAGLAAWVLRWPVATPLLAAAALLHVARIAGWHTRATLGRPILWILHAGYAFIPLGLALLAAAPWLGASAGVHALAVGATGGLVIGMVTRTARGHTGRPLQASRGEVAAYALVLAAALMRSLAVPLLPSTVLLWTAGAAWSAAFVLYLWRFAPWLVAPRADGKDG